MIDFDEIGMIEMFIEESEKEFQVFVYSGLNEDIYFELNGEGTVINNSDKLSLNGIMNGYWESQFVDQVFINGNFIRDDCYSAVFRIFGQIQGDDIPVTLDFICYWEQKEKP